MTAVDRLLNMIAEGYDRLSVEEQKRRLKAGADLLRERQRKLHEEAEEDARRINGEQP